MSTLPINADLPATSSTPAIDRPSHRYRGEVVYIYAFDLAYEIRREEVRQLLGEPVAQFAVDTKRRNPRQMFFHRAQMVWLPPVERLGPLGQLPVERSIKILPVGAISITMRVPFEVDRIEDLVAYHDLQYHSGSLYDEVRQLAEDAFGELRPFCIRPTDSLSDEEAYTVFCIETPAPNGEGERFSSEQWLVRHRRPVAALLTQEEDIEHLSPQEADESTARFLSYYQHDLIVVDWDAALVVDEKRNFDEILYVMELANLQLAELEAYDRILDEAIMWAYRDVNARRIGNRWAVSRELSEIRIDLARLADELSNITKFFGDWHLARVYEALSTRFHLGDWHRTIDDKRKTLDDMYQIIKQHQANRWMIVLEAAIVLLFVIDLVMIIMLK